MTTEELRARLAAVEAENDHLREQLHGTLRCNTVMLDALGGTFHFTDKALREVDTGTLHCYPAADGLSWTASRNPNLRKAA